MDDVKTKSQRLDPVHVRHLAAIVAEIVERDFDGNLTAAAKRIGISQPHLGQVREGSGKGAGMRTLIALRQYTQRSIDDLLGLPPLRGVALPAGTEPAVTLEMIRQAIREEKAAESSPPSPPLLPPGPPRARRP